MQRFTTMALTGALALSLASTAHAQEKISVAFEAALLDTQAGTEEVYRQMTRAARYACDDTGLFGRYPGLVRSCRDEVLSDLVRNANSPALIAMHADGGDRVLPAQKFANAERM